MTFLNMPPSMLAMLPDYKPRRRLKDPTPAQLKERERKRANYLANRDALLARKAELLKDPVRRERKRASDRRYYENHREEILELLRKDYALLSSDQRKRLAARHLLANMTPAQIQRRRERVRWWYARRKGGL